MYTESKKFYSRVIFERKEGLVKEREKAEKVKGIDRKEKEAKVRRNNVGEEKVKERNTATPTKTSFHFFQKFFLYRVQFHNQGHSSPRRIPFKVMNLYYFSYLSRRLQCGFYCPSCRSFVHCKLWAFVVELSKTIIHYRSATLQSNLFSWSC